MLSRSVGLIVLLLGGLILSSASANTVCLKSKVSGAEVRGELIRFTGTRWDLATPLGRQSFYLDDFYPCQGGGDIELEAEPTVEDTPETRATQSRSEPNSDASDPRPARGNRGETVHIAGSNTIGAALMPTLVRAYFEAEGRPLRESGDALERTLTAADDRVSIAAHGSSTGFRALAEGTATIGMASRRIRPAEVRRIARRGQAGMQSPDREHVLALDGVVPIVSEASLYRVTSVDELADLFTGRITNWAEVGLENRRIRVHARDAKSGTFDTFASLVLDGDGDAVTPAAERYERNAALAEAVAADPYAIGFVAAGALTDRVKPLALRGRCGVLQQPSVFTIKTEDYVLGRRLFLYTRSADRIGLLRDLIDYALSASAQSVIAEVGFVDRGIDTLEAGAAAPRLAALDAEASRQALSQRLTESLRRLLERVQRVSVTFRFETDSAVLDNKALQDAPLLAAYLNDAAAGRTVHLLGFADARGRFLYNQRLAQQRAQEARERLRASGVRPERIRVHGFSELNPVFCNDTPSGRAKNRRVEVWIE